MLTGRAAREMEAIPWLPDDLISSPGRSGEEAAAAAELRHRMSTALAQATLVAAALACLVPMIRRRLSQSKRRKL